MLRGRNLAFALVCLAVGCSAASAPRGLATSAPAKLLPPAEATAPAIAANSTEETGRAQIVSSNKPTVLLAAHSRVASDKTLAESAFANVISDDPAAEVFATSFEPPQPKKSRFFGPLWNDTRSLVTVETAGILLTGGLASVALRETVDEDVSEWTARSPHRWGYGSDFFAALGNPAHHFAATGVVLGLGWMGDDPQLSNFGGAMLNTLILTNAGTLALKHLADSDAPNGESLGWPSGHTSSSVALAALLDEYYGHGVGLPAYTLAGLVAWSRIDDREHDVSDVVFGAALGYAIGKVVARNHYPSTSSVNLLPYVTPDGGTGLAIEQKLPARRVAR